MWSPKSTILFLFSRLVLFAHEKHNEIGLNYAFWPIKPASVAVSHEDQLTVIYKQSYYVAKHSKTKIQACTVQYVEYLKHR